MATTTAPGATLAPSVDCKLLADLTPISQFDPSAIQELASKSSVRELRSGSVLFKTGDADDWTVYVLEGHVRVDYGEGSHETITGGSSASRLPLAPQQPRPGTAQTTSATRVLRMSSSLIDVLSRPTAGGDGGVEVEEHDTECIENRLLQHLFQDYVDEELEIPVLPEVAMKIRRRLADPDVDVAAVAQIASRDPVVAGRLVQVANSPMYRGVAEVQNCRDAIARLGLNTAQQLVTALALRGVFATKSKLLLKRMHSLWRHSAKVAATAYVLARVTPSLNPETALLAGLVHDVGALAVVSRAEHYPELLNPTALDSAVEALRAQFGSLVLRAWGFPDELVKVGLEAKEWDRDETELADYVDAVIVSQLLVSMQGGDIEQCPRLDNVPALAKLGKGDLNADKCVKVFEDAKPEASALERSLVE